MQEGGGKKKGIGKLLTGRQRKGGEETSLTSFSVEDCLIFSSSAKKKGGGANTGAPRNRKKENVSHLLSFLEISPLLQEEGKGGKRKRGERGRRSITLFFP